MVKVVKVVKVAAERSKSSGKGERRHRLHKPNCKCPPILVVNFYGSCGKEEIWIRWEMCMHENGYCDKNEG